MIEHGGIQQKVSTKEAELLRLLCLKKNQVLTREEALLSIWHDDNYFNGRSMDVFLSKLRKYLKEDPKVEIINVHGKGYKLLVH
jgi:DNA-binding response OmpR family regulator